MNTDNDMIAAIAAQAQGRPAPTPGAEMPGMAPAAATASAPEKPKANPAPTSIEKAQAKIAPSNPGDQPASQEAEIFRVGERDFTKAQILGTHQRYADLNHKWAQNKPVMDVVSAISEAAAKSGHQAAPDEIAALVDAAVKAYVKNPQMGGDTRKQSSKDTAKAAMSSDEGDEDSQYEQWEKENAVKLPPGFRDTAKTSKQMATKMDQMMSMFQQVIQGGMAGQKATQQAGEQLQQAQGLKANAATAMISNNLNSAFQRAGMAVDDATRGDFRAFAAQRGYDFPDFMDAGLTATVVADYQANKDAPEMKRYRDILSKRQPYTEVGSSSGSGASASPAGGDSMLAGMVQTAMAGRNMR